MKPKKTTHRTKEAYTIPGFTTYDTNLFNSTGRGISIYVHNSICHRVMKVECEVVFEEVCLIEIQLHGQNKHLVVFIVARLSKKDRWRIVYHLTRLSRI